MRSNAFFTVTALAVIGFGALALAQQRPPDGQPGGRGRGGPPGGGFFFGGGGGGPGASRMALLQIPEVRKELDLVDEQVAAIEKIQEELRAKYPNPFGGRGPGGPGGGDGQKGRRGRDNNEGAARVSTQWYFVQAQEQNQPGQGRRGGGQPFTDEQRAEFEKQRAERAREEKVKLAEVLLPEQMKRLTEIYIQQAGVNVLQDEEVAKELGISDAQKAKLAEVGQQSRETFAAAMRELFQGGGGDANRDANRAKVEEMRKANDAKLLAVLSGDQQKKFEAMKGKPFELPEGAGRGGPGGPGGNRGRPRGNN